MRSLLITLLASVSLLGCDNRPKSLTHLHGKPESVAIAALGAPTYRSRFELKQGEQLPELYVPIHNTYHPLDPATTGVEIRELRWDREGYTQAVFLHKVDGEWVVLDSVVWQDGIAF